MGSEFRALKTLKAGPRQARQRSSNGASGQLQSTASVAGSRRASPLTSKKDARVAASAVDMMRPMHPGLRSSKELSVRAEFSTGTTESGCASDRRNKGLPKCRESEADDVEPRATSACAAAVPPSWAVERKDDKRPSCAKSGTNGAKPQRARAFKDERGPRFRESDTGATAPNATMLWVNNGASRIPKSSAGNMEPADPHCNGRNNNPVRSRDLMAKSTSSLAGSGTGGSSPSLDRPEADAGDPT